MFSYDPNPEDLPPPKIPNNQPHAPSIATKEKKCPSQIVAPPPSYFLNLTNFEKYSSITTKLPSFFFSAFGPLNPADSGSGTFL